jgi:hypothetical protein
LIIGEQVMMIPTSTETSVARSGAAKFSACGEYRYLLTREFGGEATCVFVMLNPSTADAERDDPTIRRCIGFARREGFGRLEIVNLYGLRATKPAVLFASEDPVGPGNDRWLEESLSRANTVVVAWGNHVKPERVASVMEMITGVGTPVVCFGLTGRCQPRHPLYLRLDAELVDYRHAEPSSGPLSGKPPTNHCHAELDSVSIFGRL